MADGKRGEFLEANAANSKTLFILKLYADVFLKLAELKQLKMHRKTVLKEKIDR